MPIYSRHATPVEPRKLVRSSFVLAVLAALLTCVPALHAEPWLAPGDIGVRHDLQVLADAGIIKSPITSWPLPWADLARDILLVNAPGSLSRDEQASLRRLTQRVRLEMEPRRTNFHLRVGGAEEPRTLRTFEATPRETAELEAGVRWTGLRFSYRLQATVVADPDDDKEVRADGSYVGIVLGNWMFSAGAMDRWWGPGWDGSLILGTNQRPIPALSVNRNYSDPFSTKWLSWLGPWSTSVVWGQLEGDRTVSDPLFFGWRFNFKPVPALELGISRTAIWCGDGRPCDFDTFTDLLLGNDNTTAGGNTDDEPGNQLAGIDGRWSFRRWPVAIYGQLIGEDESGGLPSRHIGQLGAEVWGYSQRFDGSYRLHVEATDTAAEFYKDNPRYDYAYEHFIYLDGYRYRSRSIGHSMDNDSRMISVGGVLHTTDTRRWTVLLQVAELNRGGRENNRNTVASTPTDFVNLAVGHQRELGPGRIELSLGFEREEQQNTDSTDNTMHALVQWIWGY